MKKCPDCAVENLNESLFCKYCGRCLLVPDPEKVQRSTVTNIEQHKIFEGIDFYEGHIVKSSGAARLEPRHQTEPSIVGRWLLLLNFLVFILVSVIASYIAIR